MKLVRIDSVRDRADSYTLGHWSASPPSPMSMTRSPPYKPATAPHVGVRIIREGAGTQFDPDVVRHFLRIAMPYPVGYMLELPGGVEAVVAHVDPEAPEDPMVRLRDPSGQIIECAVHVSDGVVSEPEQVGLYN